MLAGTCLCGAACALPSEGDPDTAGRPDEGPASVDEGGETSIRSASVRCSGYVEPFVVANATDVDLRTRWMNVGAGSWIELERETATRLDGLAIGWYRGDQRRNRYSVLTSVDGLSYTTVVASAWSSGQTTALETTAFTSHEARFVRLVFEASNEDDWIGVTEFEWLNDLVAPDLAITDPAPAVTLTGSEIGISGTADDDLDGEGILAVEVHLDGSDRYVVATPAEDGSYARWSASFPMAPGDHTATAIAYDHAGNITTATVAFEVARLPEPYLFAAGFETGNVKEWTAGGLGDHSGGGYVTAEAARSGHYAWKAHHDPELAGADALTSVLSATLANREAYYSAWYLWPADYVVGEESGYANIFQWKEATEPYGAVFILAAMSSPAGRDELAIHDPRRNQIRWTGAAIPKGRWFNIEAYRKAGRDDGALTVWLDGVEIFSAAGLDTDGASSDPDRVAWGVGSLGGAVGRFIYVDDASVATRRLQAAAR